MTSEKVANEDVPVADDVAVDEATIQKEQPLQTSNESNTEVTYSQKWTNMINSFMKPILGVLLKLTHHAARYPKTYIVSIIAFSIAIMVIGLATNFTLEADSSQWTPQDTRSVKHGDWIDSDESGFPKDPRYIMLIVHRNGKNILGDEPQGELALDGVEHVFEALDVVRSATPGYQALCLHRGYVHPVTGQTTCDIVGVSTFWNDNTTLFQDSIKSNQDVIDAMSTKTFPSGRGVDFDQIIGYNECDDGAVACAVGGTLTSGLSYVTVVGLPGQDEMEDDAMDFEADVLDNLKDLQHAWEVEEGYDFRLELLAYRSFDDEFSRAISADIGTFTAYPSCFPRRILSIVYPNHFCPYPWKL